MRVRFTLLPAPGRAVDVLVEVAAGTPLRQIAPELAAAAGISNWVGSGQLIGVPPLLDGALLAPGGEQRPELPGPRQLRVVGGSDAGAIRSLRDYEILVGRKPQPPISRAAGRSPDADRRTAIPEPAELGLTDPQLSQRHAVLAVAADGVTVRDAGSTNGTVLWPADGSPIRLTAAPVELPPDAVVRCGGSLLSCAAATEPPAVTTPDGAGGVRVHRPPRFLATPAPATVVFPTPPSPVAAAHTPWALILGPALLGVGYWRLTGGDPGYVAVAALGPALFGASAMTERLAGWRSLRRRRARYARDVAAARAELQTVMAAEARARRQAAPDPAAVWLTALLPGARLWERRPTDPDALVVRVASGLLPATLTVQGPVPDPPPARRRFRRSPPQHRTGHRRLRLPPVPVLLPLADAGVVGLAGPASVRRALARWLVVQVVVHHPPSEVRVVVLCAPPGGAGPAIADWAWVRWLPHATDPGGPVSWQVLLERLTDALDARLAEGDAPTPGVPVYVLVLDDAAVLRGYPGVSRLLRAGPAVGITALCLCLEPLRLPAECTATVTSGARAGLVTVRRASAEPVTALADGVSLAWAEEVARALAPLREADHTPTVAGPAALAESVPFRLLAGLPDRSTAAPPRPAPGEGMPGEALVEQTGTEIARRWRRRPRSTSVPLGLGIEGPIRVDLVADGPHALIAGTTGAGKSELLQTLVTGLAIGNRPEELALLLVDYKGGAAFGAAVALPHTVGLVTDLDSRLTARALASLGAELRRREGLLARCGAPDLATYQAGVSSPGLGRLVIVVDEFAVLAAELPEFVAGLVDVARRGRSLGVHLVLATQRPAGVVSAEIRANTALRICLRVTDGADSADVLDSPAAARIPPDRPGRALLRLGGGLVAVQVARVGGPPPATLRTPPAVTVLPPRLAAAARNDPTDAAQGALRSRVPIGTDLAALVGSVRVAADQVGAVRPARPWLPPLAELVSLDALGQIGPDQLPLGLADRPAEQRQEPYVVDLAAARNLGLLGAGRSGRTTALRTLAASVAGTDLDALHLYVLDGSGGLADLAMLPHCGAVVGRDDPARAARLRAVLTAELARRSVLLATAGLGSVAEQRRSAARSERLPWLLLLVDSYEGLVSGLDELAAENLRDELGCLLRDGPAGGLTTVLTGGSVLAGTRLSGLLADRLILRHDHPDGYLAAGLPAGATLDGFPPGRALTAEPDPIEVQIAIVGTDPAGTAQVAELRHRAPADARESGQRGPVRLRPLPAQLTLASLAGTETDKTTGPLRTLIGVGGDAAAPVWLDLAADGPGALIAGPPRSGRTTALRTIALGLTRQGTGVVLVAPSRSRLRELVGNPGVLGSCGEPTEPPLATIVAGHPGRPLAVLVDDLDHFADSPIEAGIADALGSGHAGWAVVATGGIEALATAYRGPAALIRRYRYGILLMPRRPSDGDLFGIRVVGPAPRLPGRGLLVASGVEVPLQVALS